MTKALADLFASAQAARVDWDGAPAYAIFEMDQPPEAVTVEFLSSVQIPVQGLTLKLSGGTLEINGSKGPEMILWSDTVPERVGVRVLSTAATTVTLKIWNTWRATMGGVDVTQAWLGNAGMRVDRHGNEVLLRCSDGEGPVDFRDLEVRITFG